jgi:hypothetical protein
VVLENLVEICHRGGPAFELVGGLGGGEFGAWQGVDEKGARVVLKAFEPGLASRLRDAAALADSLRAGLSGAALSGDRAH